MNLRKNLYKEYQQKIKKFILSILLVLVIIILFNNTPTIIYAQKALQLVANIAVKPYYHINAQNDKLYVTTNMTLVVNGKEINYRQTK